MIPDNVKIEYKSVEVNGNIQLYDIFVDGKWHGSRRTIELAELEVNEIWDAPIRKKKREEEIAASKEAHVKEKAVKKEKLIETAANMDLTELEDGIQSVVNGNPKQVEDIKIKPKTIDWFVGQVMKQTNKKYNVIVVRDLLEKKLGIS